MVHCLISFLISLLSVSRLITYSLLVLVTGVVFISSCKKSDEATNTPVISDLTITPDTAVEFIDTLIISFKYVDRNGDLGEPNPNVNSISVKDSRLENPDWYHLKPLAPLDANVPIEGTLQIKLNNLFIIGNAPSETLNFTVQIQDREGNISNELFSHDVVVVR